MNTHTLNVSAAERDTILDALRLLSVVRKGEERAEIEMLLKRFEQPVSEPAPISKPSEVGALDGYAPLLGEMIQLGDLLVPVGSDPNPSDWAHVMPIDTYLIGHRTTREGLSPARLFRVYRPSKATQPPQAPEPVNAELTRAWEAFEAVSTWLPTRRNTLTKYVEAHEALRQAIARAESALAAQKGGK